MYVGILVLNFFEYYFYAQVMYAIAFYVAFSIIACYDQ